VVYPHDKDIYVSTMVVEPLQDQHSEN